MPASHARDESLMYAVHRVPASRAFVWLSRGLDDLLRHPLASLAYGAMVSLLGMVIFAYSRHPFLVAAVASGFLLVGPVLTAGICELSRRHDVGEQATFGHSLQVLARQREPLLGFSGVLCLVAVVWLGLSMAMLELMTGDAAPGLASTVWGDVLAQLSPLQVQVYIGVGAVLALTVFALSVVTVPMIIDRHVTAGSAMRMSLRVARRDPGAMLLWGLLIVALVGIGFASNLLGMLVIFPLLGHATWYAYRDLVV
jgi:uncharacterized membrane protein